MYIGCMARKPVRPALTADDRAFLSLVTRAVFANPFGQERADLDARIAGSGRAGGERMPSEEVMRAVRQRLERLEKTGAADIRAHGDADGELLAHAHLFDVYHQHKDALDRLLLAQSEAGDEPRPVPFAAEVLRTLQARGFDRPRSLRSLAFFFQIRRGFYFIDRVIIGRSPCMRALKRTLWEAIFTSDIRWYDRFLWDRLEDFSTLLLGETGTGKGTAAAAIGRSGCIPFDEKKGRFVESFTRAFVSINLSQFPETLIESELFGHTKGAFTGAVQGHEGAFAACSAHGAVFLDEIGEVGVPVQIKLLQILQERVFSPVGSHETRRFRGRVIAATNRPLESLRGPGGLRDDFFYRLSSDVIVVPPLRQRIAEDPRELDDLLDHTVARLLGEPSEEIASLVRQTLLDDLGPDYPWPGNVRELEQATRRIILKRRYEGDRRIPASATAAADRFLRAAAGGEIDAKQLLAGYCSLLFERHGTYQEVARRTGLDRRTVKKYIAQAAGAGT
ncbi:MAG: sigma-54-dependent Fis family transcriptional regulator [Planctomycetes bacterium]|nr:sigma-54-dependent Fis family transcriptional regulator [Planctomycetota bacterium]